MRRFAQAAMIAALALVLVPSPAAAQPDAPSETTVNELDLSGVRTSAIADLPAVAPLPDEIPATAPAVSSVPPTQAATAAPPADPAPTTKPDPLAEGPVPDPDVLTTTIDTAPFTVFGVTWAHGPEGVVIRYRVRESGTWSDWQATGASDAVPDANRVEAADAPPAVAPTRSSRRTPTACSSGPRLRAGRSPVSRLFSSIPALAPVMPHLSRRRSQTLLRAGC